MNTASYDLIAKRFGSIRIELQPKEIEYLALILDALPKGSTVLDLGCGTGNPIGVHVASRGHQVVGVDGSEAMLALARERLPEHRWVHKRMERVEFDGDFDAIICWDSLFHLPREFHAPIIGKMYRWLRPGARLMVSSGYQVDEGGTGFTDTMLGHTFFYDSLSPREMVATLKEAGFEIIRAEVCNPPDGGEDRGKWATVAEKK